MLKLVRSLAFLCLLIVIGVCSVRAQAPSPILDTNGNAVVRGVLYYILPSESSAQNGGFTLIDRNGSCPLYVGQEQSATSQGFPVIFTPFSGAETVVKESKDFRIAFSASTICVQSTAWKVSGSNSISGRRLIETGRDDGFAGYFRISRNAVGRYKMGWCPTDVCPTCRFICGDVGVVVENGKILLALDGDALSVVFKRV